MQARISDAFQQKLLTYLNFFRPLRNRHRRLQRNLLHKKEKQAIQFQDHEAVREWGDQGLSHPRADT